MSEPVVVDASALVDLLAGASLSAAVQGRLAGTTAHAPAHIDAEVLSALGRLSRAGALPAGDVADLLGRLSTIPIERHPLPELVQGAWARRDNLRLVDALYVELAARLEAQLLTTDLALARATPSAERIST